MPNLPTDNLYKFLTTLGVAIFLFSFWTVSENTKLAITNTKVYSLVSERLDSEYQELIEMINSLENDHNDLLSQLEAAKKTSPTKEELEKLNMDREVVLRQLEQVKRQFKVVLENLKLVHEKQEAASASLENSQFTLAAYKFGYFGGMVMALAGFFLWYHKHQKYQDHIVKRQALNANDQKTDDQ